MRINERGVEERPSWNWPGKLRGFSTSEAVMAAVRRHADAGWRLIVADLGGVSSVDADGMATLIHCGRLVRASGGRLCLAGLTRRIDDLVVITALVTEFDVYRHGRRGGRSAHHAGAVGRWRGGGRPGGSRAGLTRSRRFHTGATKRNKDGATAVGRGYHAVAPNMDEHEADTSIALLARAQTGDEDALNRLLARYLPRLQRWASGRLPSSARTMHDTGDLVQDAVVNALRHIDTLEIRNAGSLVAYLRQAINNRIIDLHRRAARRPDRVELPEDQPGQMTSPLEAAIGAEALARYDAALGRLDDDDRQAVVLRVELGHDYAEIADALGKPTAAAARMMVTRALARLAREMRRGQTTRRTRAASGASDDQDLGSVLRVAEAILDGSPVDWGGHDAAVAGETARQLKVLERLIDVHRRQADPALASTDDHAGPAGRGGFGRRRALGPVDPAGVRGGGRVRRSVPRVGPGAQARGRAQAAQASG